MRYIFKYPCKVAVATDDGNLAQLKFKCGAVINAKTQTYNFVENQPVWNIELDDGTVLVSVPQNAVRHD